MMDLSEAQTQILASIHKLIAEGKKTDEAAIEARGEDYWVFKEDWSGAFEALEHLGLISSGENGYSLTVAGKPLAQACHNERPDMYWYYYQKFYPAARASEAHSELCRRVFGEDLCQEGQTDMPSLEHLIELIAVKPGENVLDLGCGAGVIAEYLSDRTGASVLGLDYAASAIEEATTRTEGKRDRLTFEQGNFNALDFSDGTFDAIISLDTLYWASDLEATLSALHHSLNAGGRIAIFMNHHIGAEDPPELLAAQYSELAKAAEKLGLPVETFEYTRQIREFWRRIYDAATALKDAFEAEGNGFIAESLIRESEEDYLPDVEAGRIARHLYLIRG